MRKANKQSHMQSQIKQSANIIHWLNQTLNWRIEERDGDFFLYNGFGYTGRYDSLRSALLADAQMNNEPFETFWFD